MTQVNPELYDQQFDQKLTTLKALLSPYYTGVFDTFESPRTHYRMRAEFKIWHEGDKAHYAMFERGSNRQPILMTNFDVATASIDQLMPILLNELNADQRLKRKLFHVEFLATLSGDMLVTLIYHRPLDEEWIELAKALEEKLDIAIIGRSRKQKIVISRDYVDETLEVNNTPLHYRQIEGGFTQPNASVCEKMLGWAVSHTEGSEHRDLLELYCGNGNFGIALARNFRKVLATEMAKPSIKAALHNADVNHVENLSIARLSAEEFTQAWNRERPFKRLAHIDLDTFDVSTIFVDPPRAGLDDGTVKLCQKFERIVYISCNPNTLADNLSILSTSHKVTSAALFDQFPYTDHMEAGVVLERR